MIVRAYSSKVCPMQQIAWVIIAFICGNAKGKRLIIIVKHNLPDSRICICPWIKGKSNTIPSETSNVTDNVEKNNKTEEDITVLETTPFIV